MENVCYGGDVKLKRMVELLEYSGFCCKLECDVGNVEVFWDSVIVRKTIGDVYVWFAIKEDGSVEVFREILKDNGLLVELRVRLEEEFGKESEIEICEVM